MKSVTLNNGVVMPLRGFGTFQITDFALCEKSVLTALKTGYRLIDTAACYGNERAVGSAVMKSGIPRNEIFLVSKVWIQDSGYEKTIKSFEKTLENLQTDYLDLYLIHMPFGDYHGSWRAMEELYRKGKIKALGVCNFLSDRLEDLILTHDIVPAVNQIELHPLCGQKRLLQTMKEHSVKPMAWAPFAEGKNDIFKNATLLEIGNRFGKSAAQAILKWLEQKEIVAIPKSVHQNRIIENFDTEDFTLTNEDMKRIDDMDLCDSLILDIHSTDEVKRLHGIKFKQ